MVFNAKPASLLVANYASGRVSVVPVQKDGSLSPVSSVQITEGTGPHVRQKAPHPHAVVVDPSGRYVLVPDLGADKIFVYRFDRADMTLSPADPAYVSATPGSGPRHIVFHPNGHLVYVNGELNGELTTYHWDAKA